MIEIEGELQMSRRWKLPCGLARLAVVIVLQGVCAMVAMAADKVVEKPVSAETLEKFAHTAAQIREEMGSGGRYEFISSEDGGKVNADLDTLGTLLQKSGSVKSMPQAELTRLFDIQEHLNSILSRADRNRLVCERIAPTGSTIMVRTCRTVGEIEEARRTTQQYIREQGQRGDVSHRSGG
jgi:hypothetical protein